MVNELRWRYISGYAVAEVRRRSWSRAEVHRKGPRLSTLTNKLRDHTLSSKLCCDQVSALLMSSTIPESTYILQHAVVPSPCPSIELTPTAYPYDTMNASNALLIEQSA